MSSNTTKTYQNHSPFRVGATPKASGFCGGNSLFVKQRSTANYYTPYKFSGKEKDEEISYSFFGARYYMSDVSVWLSVDPMWDKYPNISPYAYCNWNPVMLVDPDGNQGWPIMARTAMGQQNYINAHTFPIQQIGKAYNSLPPQAQRGLNATWNIVSGVCQTFGGIALGVTTFESGVGAAAGIVVATHGGYKVSVGFEQMANVISGGEAKNDPGYVTPEGSITKNKTVDNVTDLTVGFSYTKPKNFVDAVNAVSTVKTGFDVGKDIINTAKDSKAIKNNTSSTSPTSKSSNIGTRGPLKSTEKYEMPTMLSEF